MKATALGLIETKGYVGAIEAADAALKAANVTLIKLERIRSGLVTVLLSGDVGAIQAAVDAGKLAAEKCGNVISTHVIPRPHEETAKVLLQQDKREADAKEVKAEAKAYVKVEVEAESEMESVTEMVGELISEQVSDANKGDQSTEVQSPEAEEDIPQEQTTIEKEEDSESAQELIFNVEDLKGKKVEELRKLARSLHLENVKPSEIKYGRKDFLIKILTDSNREEGASK